MSDNPYQPPSAALDIPAPEQQLVLAGLGTRLGAVMLDGLLVSVIFLPLLMLGFYFGGFFDGAPRPELIAALNGGMGYLVQLGIGAIGFLVFVAVQGWPLAQYGQTWGKRMLGIRIVDLQGRKPDFVRMLLLRYGVGQVAGVIPCIGALYGLTDALFIFREDRRCVHDLLAGTRVVMADRIDIESTQV